MKSQTKNRPPNKEDDEETTVTKIAREFGEMSLMHGIRFIANRKATIAERYDFITIRKYTNINRILLANYL